jgi:hypothetical protein
MGLWPGRRFGCGRDGCRRDQQTDKTGGENLAHQAGHESHPSNSGGDYRERRLIAPFTAMRFGRGFATYAVDLKAC